MNQVLIVGGIVVAVGVIAALSVTMPDRDAAGSGQATPALQSPTPSPAPAPATTTSRRERLANTPRLTPEETERLISAVDPDTLIQNPQPWQFDAARNQYWDPGHKHWHPGTAPETRTMQTPTDWTYCPATDKHWNPLQGHQHWHEGPVPAPENRGG